MTSIHELVSAYTDADEAIDALTKELRQYDDSDEPYPPLLKKALDALIYLAAQVRPVVEREAFPERPVTITSPDYLRPPFEITCVHKE